MTDQRGREQIFTAYITTKSGKRLYASAYGRKAWAIWVKKKKLWWQTKQGGFGPLVSSNHWNI
jgi:hypothetical protein